MGTSAQRRRGGGCAAAGRPVMDGMPVFHGAEQLVAAAFSAPSKN